MLTLPIGATSGAGTAYPFDRCHQQSRNFLPCDRCHQWNRNFLPFRQVQLVEQELLTLSKGATSRAGTAYLATGAISGTGTAYPSREHEFTPCFQRGLCCPIFSFPRGVFLSLLLSLFCFFFLARVFIFLRFNGSLSLLWYLKAFL